MTFGAGFKTVTATVKRGGPGDFADVGTLSVHLQELPSKAKVGFGGIYPMDAKAAYYEGALSLEVRQHDILTISSNDYVVLDVIEWDSALVDYTKIIIQGLDVEV